MDSMESASPGNHACPGNSRDVTVWSEINESVLLDLDEPFENQNTSVLRNDIQYQGFDNNVGGQYIYPINLPIRTYQFNITKAALFKNTLVVLPTGLGKTFIAAVVMYNIYRWYPMAKVIFMAPTRPLVSQQIDACRKIMGIPERDTIEMTGKQNKKIRINLWQDKRIFFATPQVVQLDINDPELNFPFDLVKLVVVDEAHKAKGKYAYTEVIQSLYNRNLYFRVLALSATPGRRIEDVMEIVQNLCISHIEVRNENSIDVLQYTYKKNMKTIVVPLGEQLTNIRNELINIIDPYIKNLNNFGVVNGNTENLTKFVLLMEQKRFRETSINERHPKHSTINTDFSTCISLYHSLELLERHGLRVFLNFFDDPESKNEKFFIKTNFKLRNFLNNLREKIGPNPFSITDQTITNGKIPNIPKISDFGHPKFEMVKNILLDHFAENNESKVIIFCEFRESVLLMHRLLLQSRPIVMPKMFVGQGGTRAVSQKEQIQIMNDFRNGIVNTLIATSVAEEGIDVGEVDLIICFDISSKNPTRFVQRIGRTGRRRQGKVIMLATEGKEHSVVKEVLAAKDKVNQKIVKSRVINNVLFTKSPRIVPPEYNPKCLEVFMKSCDEEIIVKKSKKDTNKIKEVKVKNSKKPPCLKQINAPASQDVRNFFKKIELHKEEKEISPTNTVPDDDLIHFDRIELNRFTPVTQFENLVQPANKSADKLEIYFRKLNHLARHLDKKSTYPDYSNIEETIKSKSLDKNFKKFILKNNKEFVRKNYEAMKIIWSLNDENENDLKNVHDSEKKIRQIYSIIENIFGDKFEIEWFLQENYDIKFDQYKNFKKLDKKYSHLFEEFEGRNFTDNVENFINKKLEQIDLNLSKFEENKIVLKKAKNCSMYDNLVEMENEASLFNFEMAFNVNENAKESKYLSQLVQFDHKNIKNQSTPISKNKSHNLRIEESPLIKNFQKENKEKVENCKEKLLALEKQTVIVDLSIDLSKKTNSKNISKNYEISADLFDDDFDEIFAESDLLKCVDGNCSSKIPSKSIINSKILSSKPVDLQKNNPSSSTFNAKNLNISEPKINDKNLITDPDEKMNEEFLEASILELQDSMLNISEILRIVAAQDEDKNENKNIEENSNDLKFNESFFQKSSVDDEIFDIVTAKEKTTEHNLTNQKLENFDLNDFLEPFEEEKEVIFKRTSQKENSPPSPQSKNKNQTINNFLTPRQISNDFINKSISKTVNKNKHTQDIEELNKTSPSIIGRIPELLKSNSHKLNTVKINNSLQSSQTVSKYFVNQAESSKIVDESVIVRPKRNKKLIFESSDSEEDDELKSEVLSSQEIGMTPQKDQYIRSWNERKNNRRKKRISNFIHDEAGHSDDDSDEDRSTLDENDSIIVTDDEEEEDDPNVNMHAKYLQSIRSPNIASRGCFKIPTYRKFMDLTKICSQPIQPDDSLDVYKECSFVVSDDDDVDNICEISEMCPLEEAEAIIKARRTKRKQFKNSNNLPKRRRIISPIIELSSDNENE